MSFKHLGSDARGAVSVEYVILVGVVALAVLAGFRTFGEEINKKVECQARAVLSLSMQDCSGGGTGNSSEQTVDIPDQAPGEPGGEIPNQPRKEPSIDPFEPASLDETLASTRTTPTGRALLDELERLGVPIVELPADEYARRFPNSAGVTVDGTIYVPQDGVTINVIAHEAVHATVGDVVDDGTPEEAGDLFEKLGLDRRDGELITQLTQGFPGYTSQHVATWVLVNHNLERELAGLPPLPREVQDEVIRRAAQRELAIALLEPRNEDRNSYKYDDAALIKQWAATPIGQSEPPQGNTQAERAAIIRSRLQQYEEEAYVEAAIP